MNEPANGRSRMERERGWNVEPLPVPSPSDILTPLVLSLVVAVFAALAALAASANLRLLPFDDAVRDAIRGFGGEPFAVAMRWTTKLGSRWFIALATIPMAALAWRRCKQIAMVLVAAFPAALALELILKAVVDRPRPIGAMGVFGSSFPSGHVIAAMAFWGLLSQWTYLVTRRVGVWVASVVISAVVLLAVGVSRVYLGAHWPSDVLGGYLGGAVFLLAAEWAVRRPLGRLRCDACDFHPLRHAHA